MPAFNALTFPNDDQSPISKTLFLGEKWAGADRDALKRAQEDESAGVPRDEVWRRHLWGRLPEGQWVTESDDRNVGFSPEAMQGLKSGKRRRIDDRNFLTSDQTVTGWPGGERYTTEFLPADPSRPPGVDAEFGGHSTQVYAAGGSDGHGKQYPPQDILQAVVHERQHKADDLGGIGSTVTDDPREGLLYELHHDNMAHEARARAVERRIRMTPEQRRDRPFWLDYPVPESDLIYKSHVPDKFNPEVEDLATKELKRGSLRLEHYNKIMNMMKPTVAPQ